MRMFLWNILLALVWAALRGELTPVNLAVGFLLGYLVLFSMQPILGRSSYFVKVRQVVGFLLFFLWELVLANLRMAWHVLRPGHMRPGVIAIPLDARSDAEITMLANLISLTPGTLSLDVSTDRRFLYVHAIRPGDPDAFRREIKQGLEKKVLETLQ